ncbi:hypothetical protein DFQ27_001696 [Actinomortierella ambigua]|uniref:CoA-binding domain-containing protein n=1 Tax=Actinomortierella ambigua TaxID=1343610 RepID=A0A9P6QBJ9_9FUNG|nr:hypothetical protein DFQ27_001696 [Actinomortierella ambigua]
MEATIKQWFDRTAKFAVVGARSRPELFGNSVIRFYIEQEMSVVPICDQEDTIEGLATVPDLASLPGSPQDYRLSIVLDPSETRAVLEEAHRLGIRQIWLEPGVDSPEALAYADQVGLPIIAGEYSVLLEGLMYA